MDLYVYLKECQKVIDFTAQNPDLKFSADVAESFEKLKDRILTLNRLVEEMLKEANVPEPGEDLTNVSSFRPINSKNYTYVARDIIESFADLLERARSEITTESKINLRLYITEFLFTNLCTTGVIALV